MSRQVTLMKCPMCKSFVRPYEISTRDFEKEIIKKFVKDVVHDIKLDYESSMNGAADISGAYWNRGLDRAIEILESAGVKA